MNCSKLPRWYRFPGCQVRGPIALVLLSCAGLSFASACVEGDTPGEPVFAPEVIGTASVPLSDNNEVVLLADGRVACVTESYDDRVHCVDLEGVVVGRFGREGQGPGEFGGAASLVRGDRGTIGVVDFELSRFSVFEPSGAFVSSVSLPGVTFSPVASFDTVVTGVSRRFLMPGEDDDGPLMTLYEVNIASGETVREEASRGGPWDVECARVISGIPDRRGGWAFLACGGYLVFDGGAGTEATVVRAPTYAEEFPDERDVARRRGEIESLNQGFRRVGPRPYGKRRGAAGKLPGHAQALLPVHKPALVRRRQPLLGRHPPRPPRVVLPGRVRKHRILGVGEGQGSHAGLRPDGVDPGGAGRAAARAGGCGWSAGSGGGLV